MSHLRGVRYSSFISAETLTSTAVTVVGCGAIGLQSIRMLAAMGVGSLTLYDSDTVSEENLGPQQWPVDALGLPKVDAAAAIACSLNPACSITGANRRWTPSDDLTTPIVFSCADCMDTRKALSRAFRTQCKTSDAGIAPLFIDARMAAFYLEVHTHTPSTILSHYSKTLFPPPPPEERAPCTARATSFCAQMAASWMLTHLFAHLRSQPFPPLLRLSLTHPPEIELS